MRYLTWVFLLGPLFSFSKGLPFPSDAYPATKRYGIDYGTQSTSDTMTSEQGNAYSEDPAVTPQASTYTTAPETTSYDQASASGAQTTAAPAYASDQSSAYAAPTESPQSTSQQSQYAEYNNQSQYQSPARDPTQAPEYNRNDDNQYQASAQDPTQSPEYNRNDNQYQASAKDPYQSSQYNQTDSQYQSPAKDPYQSSQYNQTDSQYQSSAQNSNQSPQYNQTDSQYQTQSSAQEQAQSGSYQSPKYNQTADYNRYELANGVNKTTAGDGQSPSPVTLSADVAARIGDSESADTTKYRPVTKETTLNGNHATTYLELPKHLHKPAIVKYQVQIAPKTRGVPIEQEIAVMAPEGTGGDRKPLVLLKQTVEKATEEHIQIVVPKGDTDLVSSPKVEVKGGSLQQEDIGADQGQSSHKGQSSDQSQSADQGSNSYQSQSADQSQSPTEAPYYQSQNPTEAPSYQGQNADQSQSPTEAPSYQSQNPTEAPSYQGQNADQSQSPTEAPSYQSQNPTEAPSYQGQNANQSQSPTEAPYQDQYADQSQSPTEAPSYQDQYAGQDQTAGQDQASAAATDTAGYQDATGARDVSCEDLDSCSRYNPSICDQTWMKRHCRKMCGLCSDTDDSSETTSSPLLNNQHNPKECYYGGIVHESGDIWSPGPCIPRCECRDGVANCSKVECPDLNCKKPVKRKWKCCPECLPSQDADNVCGVDTHGGNAENLCCVFPFNYNGVDYFTCTTADRKEPWCSITRNFDRDGLWGYCSEDSKVEAKDSRGKNDEKSALVLATQLAKARKWRNETNNQVTEVLGGNTTDKNGDKYAPYYAASPQDAYNPGNESVASPSTTSSYYTPTSDENDSYSAGARPSPLAAYPENAVTGTQQDNGGYYGGYQGNGGVSDTGDVVPSGIENETNYEMSPDASTAQYNT